MFEIFILIPLYLGEIFGWKTPISTYTSTAENHNIIVIVLKVLPCKRAVIGSMRCYQQVVMCGDDVVMWYVS